MDDQSFNECLATLQEAREAIREAKNELQLQRLQNEGMASLLHDVQLDCIQWRQMAERMYPIIEDFVTYGVGGFMPAHHVEVAREIVKEMEAIRNADADGTDS